MIGGMRVALRLRRLLARLLPAPVKAFLRRTLPARLFAPPAIRDVRLAMPVPPSGLGPSVRPAAVPPFVEFRAPWQSYVPRLLDRDGIAGYEPETMAAFLAAISLTGATDVFDVGANVGAFSIVAAAATTARVTAFEPTPDLAAIFRAMAAGNGLACEVEAIALGAETGTATLFVSSKSDSSNSLQAGFRRAVGTVEVPVERLDDYVARSGRVPGVLKVDTETTEPDVLAGGVETIRRVRPWIICEVLAGRTEAALATAFGDLGYHAYHLDGTIPPRETTSIVGDITYAHRDWLFTPEPLPAAFGDHYAAWIATLRAAV